MPSGPVGGGHDNLLDAGHLGGNHIHQHGGGVGRGATGHIDAGFFDGGVLLAQQHAGRPLKQNVLVDLLLVEGPDVVGSHLQGADELRLHRGKGLVDLSLADPQIPDLGMVKLAGVVPQGVIAPGTHIGNDGVHGGLHVGLGTDIAVENLLRFQGIKGNNADHFASASFMAFCKAVMALCLNL